MVTAVNNNGIQIVPTAPASVNPAGTGTTPVFSVSSLTANPGTGASAAGAAAESTSSAAASQYSDAASDFRQLFSGVVPLATPFTTQAASDAMNFGNPAPGTPAVSVASLGGIASPADATVASPPFVPVFQTASVTDGTTVWPLNSQYFADQPTAQRLADEYGTGQVVQTPFFSGGGPYSASSDQNEIVLANGRTVNAGVLASYYVRNPESEFPGLADTLIRNQLAQDSPV